MLITFTPTGWEQYLEWQFEDRKLVKKINELLKDISRNPFEGIGKPEALKHNLKGFWSRRINSKHRLVYEAENDNIFVISCKYHY